MKSPIQLFSGAGASGHVFLVRNGKRKDRGLAYSGLVGPMTAVAIVPTTAQILNFSVEVLTEDLQAVTVAGNVKVTLSPPQAVVAFDFTANKVTGAYVSSWQGVLSAAVIEKVLAPIQDKAKSLKVEAAAQSHQDFERALLSALQADEMLRNKGIVVESCFVSKIVPIDEEVAEAIGSEEREAMLAESDAATHERQMKASANDRKLKEYEADTLLKLEGKRKDLLVAQKDNEKAKADIDAEGTSIRLAPLQGVAGGTLLAAALMEASKSGTLGNLVVTTDLLVALGARKE